MADQKDEPTGFKVVDRRTFSDDGSRRDEPLRPKDQETAAELRASPTKPAPEAPERHGPAVVSSQPEARDSEEFQRGDLTTFETLVSYLTTTAMFQLGLLPGPGGEPIPTDFVNARRTIDLLEVLQQKTRGNLTDDEAGTLEDALYELRMSFVEVQNHLTRKGQ